MHEQGCYDIIYNGVIMPHSLYVARTPRIKVKEYDARMVCTTLNDLLQPAVKRYSSLVEHSVSTWVTGRIAKPAIDDDYIFA